MRRARRAAARASVILLAEVQCHSAGMARRSRISSVDAGETPADLFDYARSPAASRERKHSSGRPTPEEPSTWTVTDDWLDEVLVTEAEIEVFEAWFGDLFDKLFSTRH
jgi:hypothetical protein